MSKTKSTTNYEIVNGVRIYNLDYLAHGDIQESDLDSLLTNKHLIYSLIVNMFKCAGYKFRPNTIMNMIKENNKWFDKYTWTSTQLTDFETILEHILYNIYRYRNEELKSYVQWFIIHYGLTVKN